ncbi:hypothetical protein ACH5RR_034829 [Cinchona calisaya]|uniref:Uncharacterized protein n=1 Tax=Cinchona calisaya TaxID=153742 RepID=A0ABD2YC16_9GENT
MSLHSRLDILCDEADRESESIVDDDRVAGLHLSTGKQIPLLDLQLQRQYSSLSFPRRLFVPWLAGTYICDYILPSETIEVPKDHCVELMSLEAPEDASAILELESEAHIITSTGKSFWDITSHSSTESKPDGLLSKNSVEARSLGIETKVAKSEHKVAVQPKYIKALCLNNFGESRVCFKTRMINGGKAYIISYHVICFRKITRCS